MSLAHNREPHSRRHDTLFLAVGAVRKHLDKFFGKLGVESRTQCIARARELGLIG
jgi:ATP/maltotriose-dependent transcriptional regulator MalT